MLPVIHSLGEGPVPSVVGVRALASALGSAGAVQAPVLVPVLAPEVAYHPAPAHP